MKVLFDGLSHGVEIKSGSYKWRKVEVKVTGKVKVSYDGMCNVQESESECESGIKSILWLNVSGGGK